MMRDVEQEIFAQVDPALLFEIEEKLGTIPEPRPPSHVAACRCMACNR